MSYTIKSGNKFIKRDWDYFRRNVVGVIESATPEMYKTESDAKGTAAGIKQVLNQLLIKQQALVSETEKEIKTKTRKAERLEAQLALLMDAPLRSAEKKVNSVRQQLANAKTDVKFQQEFLVSYKKSVARTQRILNQDFVILKSTTTFVEI